MKKLIFVFVLSLGMFSCNKPAEVPAEVITIDTVAVIDSGVVIAPDSTIVVSDSVK